MDAMGPCPECAGTLVCDGSWHECGECGAQLECLDDHEGEQNP